MSPDPGNPVLPGRAPEPKGTPIHVVSQLHFRPVPEGKPPKLPEVHVAAFYHTLEEALACIEVLDTECGYYSHCLIESYNPGYIPWSTAEYWYERNVANSSWSRIEKPDDLKQTVHFALS